MRIGRLFGVLALGLSRLSFSDVTFRSVTEEGAKVFAVYYESDQSVNRKHCSKIVGRPRDCTSVDNFESSKAKDTWIDSLYERLKILKEDRGTEGLRVVSLKVESMSRDFETAELADPREERKGFETLVRKQNQLLQIWTFLDSLREDKRLRLDENPEYLFLRPLLESDYCWIAGKLSSDSKGIKLTTLDNHELTVQNTEVVRESLLEADGMVRTVFVKVKPAEWDDLEITSVRQISSSQDEDTLKEYWPYDYSYFISLFPLDERGEGIRGRFHWDPDSVTGFVIGLRGEKISFSPFFNHNLDLSRIHQGTPVSFRGVRLKLNPYPFLAHDVKTEDKTLMESSPAAQRMVVSKLESKTYKVSELYQGTIMELNSEKGWALVVSELNGQPRRFYLDESGEQGATEKEKIEAFALLKEGQKIVFGAIPGPFQNMDYISYVHRENNR